MGIFARRICFACELFFCTLASWIPRLGVNALMIWGIYSHIFSICLVVFSNPVLQGIYISIGVVLYILSFVSYLETVRVGAGSPIDVSKKKKNK